MDRLLLGELFLGLGSAVVVFFSLRGSLKKWRLQKTRKTWLGNRAKDRLNQVVLAYNIDKPR